MQQNEVLVGGLGMAVILTVYSMLLVQGCLWEAG